VGSSVNARLEHLFLDFENNCVNCVQRDPYYSSSNVARGLKFLAIYSLCEYPQEFSRKKTSNDSGVARHAHVLQSLGEVHSLCAQQISLIIVRRLRR